MPLTAFLLRTATDFTFFSPMSLYSKLRLIHECLTASGMRSHRTGKVVVSVDVFVLRFRPMACVRSICRAGCAWRKIEQLSIGATLLALWMIAAPVRAESGEEKDTHKSSETVDEKTNRGAFTVVKEDEQKSDWYWETTAWIVPTKDPTHRVRLDEPFDRDHGRVFFISPDERWICAVVHVHSQMQGILLYQRQSGFQFKPVAEEDAEDMEESDVPEWEFRDGDDFGPAGKVSPPGDHFAGARNYFLAWSSDSARLLVEKRLRYFDPEAKEYIHYIHYFYFNLRGSNLENTDYLRTLNRTTRDSSKPVPIVPDFAEPLQPLPTEQELRKRNEAATRHLNSATQAVLSRLTSDEEKAKFAVERRNWLQALTAGAKGYAKLGPATQRKKRELLFLADSTENRAWELGLQR
jgi:hypothetical protein